MAKQNIQISKNTTRSILENLKSNLLKLFLEILKNQSNNIDVIDCFTGEILTDYNKNNDNQTVIFKISDEMVNSKHIEICVLDSISKTIVTDNIVDLIQSDNFLDDYIVNIITSENCYTLGILDNL